MSNDKQGVEDAIISQLMNAEHEWTIDTFEVVRDIGLQSNFGF